MTDLFGQTQGVLGQDGVFRQSHSKGERYKRLTGTSNYERRIFEDLASHNQSIRQLLILYDDLLTENRRLFQEREAYKAVAEERVSTWTPQPINSQPP